MEKDYLTRRDLLTRGLIGLVGGMVTLASGLAVPQTAVARDDDPSGEMDEAGLHMYICNYIDDDGKPVGVGRTRFRGKDKVTLVLHSTLIYKKTGHLEIIDPEGNRVSSSDYVFKKTWGGEGCWLQSSAERLKQRAGEGAYAGKFYFNKEHKKTISFDVF